MIKNFIKKEQGAVAIITALSMFSIVSICVFAVEIGRVSYIQAMVTQATDAAAVAAAKYDDDNAASNAQAIFDANFTPGYMGTVATLETSISADKNEISVSSTVILPTIIGKFLGVDNFNAGSSAKTYRQFSGLEVALVLDITGSMGADSKIDNMRAAALSFIDTIYADQNTRDKTAISIVPFVALVNIGPQNTHLLENPTNALTTDVGGKFPVEAPWYGCVMAQGYTPFPVGGVYQNYPFEPGQGVNPTFPVNPYNDETVDSPDASHPLQRWEVFYAESTRALWGNGSDNSWSTTEKPYKINPSGLGTTNGPNRSCPPPLLPLTNNKALLNAYINSLNVASGGGTMGAFGVIWGLRNIDPNWDGYWKLPVGYGSGYNTIEIQPYGLSNNRKVIIFMTDGENVWANGGSGITNGDPTAYGAGAGVQVGDTATGRYVAGKGGFVSPGVSTSVIGDVKYAQNAKILRICDLAKSRGVEIYTLSFLISSTEAQDTMKACATGPTYYYNIVNSGDIVTYFTEIAQQLLSIRISQ